jgi:membrane fusion protein (multidrug efflux system)
MTVLLQRTGTEAAPQVPSQAVMVDGRGEFVFVVSPEGLVEERRVALGEQVGARRIVKEGLQPGEQVIVRGLQKAQPGQPVEATLEQTASEGK